MQPLPTMNENEIANCEIIADEAGFGAMQTERGNLPLKSLKIDGLVTGLHARLTMRQTYVNGFDGPLEATYIFPLPPRAAVVEFKMLVNDRVIDGVLKERGEARREYREAIESGKRASIVEEDRPDVFNMRVGNIAPGEEATIEMTMVMPLVFADGEATLRFPLVVAPRYIPGEAIGDSVGDGVAADTHDVPDASRITPPTLLPGFPNPVALDIEFRVDRRNFDIRELRSSLHTVTKAENDGETVVRVEPGERVNRDFILRFSLGSDDVSTGLMLVPDKDANEGTFFATVLPGERTSTTRPRDIVFVLDRSGSMSGWKMVAARRALGRMVDTLSADDRFGLIAFDTQSESPDFADGALAQADNRHRYKAIEWLSGIDARGGTEMAQPIFAGLELLDSSSGRDAAIVLVTDGQVGNEDQILRGVQQRLAAARVFTVGIDQAVNAGFLKRLAELGGGQCELVESEDRLDEVMDRLHQTIDTPLMTELRLKLEGGELIADTIVPSRAATLFAGAPLTISGRYRGEASSVSATLTGAHDNGENARLELEGTRVDDPRLAAVWARQRVRSLEDQYAAGDASETLRDEIIETSLKYGVLCRFTSFVAVDRSGDTVDGPRHEATQPVDQPEGWNVRRGAPAPRSAPASGGPPMAQAAFGSQALGGSFDEADGEMAAPKMLRMQSPPMEKKARSPKRSSRGRSASSVDFTDDVKALYELLLVLLTGKSTLEGKDVSDAIRRFLEAASFASLPYSNAREFAEALASAAEESSLDFKSLDFAEIAHADTNSTPMVDLIAQARAQQGFQEVAAVALTLKAALAIAPSQDSGEGLSSGLVDSLSIDASGQLLVHGSAGSRPGLIERFARLFKSETDRSDNFWK